MFGKLLARDLAILLAAGVVWKLAAAASAGQGPLGDFAGVVAGLGTGIGVFLVHEWGHLLGALATAAQVTPAKSLASPFLFSFDSRSNSRRQFLVMSFGGWLASGIAAVLAYTLLAPDLFAARVARGVVALNVFLILVIELPLVGWSLVTGRVPPVENQPRMAEAQPG